MFSHGITEDETVKNHCQRLSGNYNKLMYRMQENIKNDIEVD